MKCRIIEKRQQQWENWKKFGATKRISQEEDKRLLAQGAERCPLVARNDMFVSKRRSDSPTAGIDATILILSSASSHEIPIRCGDLESLFFQVGKPSRVLFLTPPPEGTLVGFAERRLLVSTGTRIWPRRRRNIFLENRQSNPIGDWASDESYLASVVSLSQRRKGAYVVRNMWMPTTTRTNHSLTQFYQQCVRSY